MAVLSAHKHARIINERRENADEKRSDFRRRHLPSPSRAVTPDSDDHYVYAIAL